MIGLYDHQGILRFAGPSSSDCLAYAELFALPQDSFTLESLEKVRGSGLSPVPPPDAGSPAGSN